MQEKNISKSMLSRLPIYLHFLKSDDVFSRRTVSSAYIAKSLGLGEVQVRKDLASISGAGKPKIGYLTVELVSHLQQALGIKDETNVIIVGAGKLGRALLSYDGFAEYRIKILAAFDKRFECLSKETNDLRIRPMFELNGFCKQYNIKIAIITVPENQAQSVCDSLVSCNIKAIWNFSPTKLNVPDGILVKNENVAASLAVLACRV